MEIDGRRAEIDIVDEKIAEMSWITNYDLEIGFGNAIFLSGPITSHEATSSRFCSGTLFNISIFSSAIQSCTKIFISQPF